VRFTFDDLVAVMAALRAPGGCPWDREQTHATLAPYLIEEVHEVLDAIGRGDPAALRAELGDVLLQVVFHAQMAHEAGAFDAAGVVDGLTRKLLVRHPHVFGDLRLGTPREVKAHWDELKRREAPDRDPLAAIPATLPALARAQKVLERSGEDATAAPRRLAARLQDALGRLADRDALGDLLLAAVMLAAAAGIDAESALRDVTARLTTKIHAT
jgi:XTP/dITP diphosphohydrolase